MTGRAHKERKPEPRRKVAGRLCVGTSGWHYGHWKGAFYPPDLRDADMLDFYKRRFASVEINASFYRLPSVDVFAGWKRAVPPDFLFAVKASRYLTHMKKLKDPEQGLDTLFASVRALGRKRGPILFQLPPGWKVDPPRLKAFLKALPVSGRYAFEFRNPTWHVPAVMDLLKEHNAAFCIYELGGFSSPFTLTADFAYVRLHGPGPGAYQGRYSPEDLRTWAHRIRGWFRTLKAVYVYFDNDEHGYAPENAEALLRMPGLAKRTFPAAERK